MNADFLSQILSHQQSLLRKRKNLFSSTWLKFQCRQQNFNRQFKAAIASPGKLNLIAEIKKASPSRGVLVKDFNPVEIAQSYEEAGAVALSILTEEKYFLGSLDSLKEVRQKAGLPILRKDFIIDEFQIYESYACGADALLLIAQILSREKLVELLNLSKKLGLDVLVEVHDEADLKKVLDTPAEIIGINNRNLHDFSVHLETTRRLISLIPKDKIVVAESGIKTREDILFLQDLCVDAVLIGEALLESGNIPAKIEELFYD